ncbi:protein of unknown function [Nocardioides terrae]|uniref:HNH nuclease domain-containing protein n=1 Tax=Nocardioides terrae TaxID=574651 RepID=A0A1I1DAY0_9ACTN|nr:protein of unknown function [Nocardioides terrae]
MSPVFMESSAREVAMRGVVAARAQLDELELRLIACSADVAQTDAGRDVAAWQVAHNRRDRKAARADQRLAEALDRRYEVLRAGLADGTVHVDQAHVIARALDDLPAEVAIETRAKAETVLVGLAAQHTPSELRRLGKRILQALDLDDAEAALARRLEAEEASAFKKTSLSLRPDGDGTTRITAVLPDAVAHRLQTYLDAFTSPRRSERRGEGTYPQILGQAFCSLLERLDPAILPQHGGRATTVLVTISLESLRNDLGVGEVVGGEALSATEIRRLACTAGIAPVVLGGKGEVLDLGRERRLFSNAQNKAIAFRDKTCRAEGCDMPASMCETHHWREWSKGGRTDLNDGVSLCSHHHHRVHDPRYTADRLANGDVRFARRR